MTSVPKIHVRFKQFDKDMRDAWESFCLVRELAVEAHNSLKAKTIDPPHLEQLSGKQKKLSRLDTFGAISHLKDKAQPRTTLLEVVACFEDYLSWLVETVLIDFPYLLKGNAPQAEKEGQKLLDLIVDCTDRAEMLEHLIEEKVRGIFYGNPIDVLTKTKAKVNFGTYFAQKCAVQLRQYSEIVARRNAIAHNNGRVDRKYLREVSGTTLKLGQVVPLPSSYLRDSIVLLRCLAGRATELILFNHYSKTKPTGKLAERLGQCKSFPAI
jgi:hypothetical protein